VNLLRIWDRLQDRTQDSSARTGGGRTRAEDIPKTVIDQIGSPESSITTCDLASRFVTLLFTDIEGSTRLWERYPVDMRTALAQHDAVLHKTIRECGGEVFKTFGDAVCAVFGDPVASVSAALFCQQGLVAHEWGPLGPLRVRMAVHSGEVFDGGTDYFGPTVNRVARILSAGHGGQVLVSCATRDLVVESLPNGVGLRDLASHRLKDLGQPEHVFQLVYPGLPYEFPPLKSLQAHANNIPAQNDSFVGRKAEMREIEKLLDTSRLLTLIGSAGCGKSRLAIQTAAERIERYGDGVWYVDLAEPSNPAPIGARVAAVLGITGLGTDNRQAEDALCRRLSNKHLLLVFDNCDSHAAEARGLGEKLLGCCSKVRILATSRHRLDSECETAWTVPPLTAPNGSGLGVVGAESLDELLAYDAVRLFVERASDAGMRLVLDTDTAKIIAERCRHMGGLPIAIEAASKEIMAIDVPSMHRRILGHFGLSGHAPKRPVGDELSPASMRPAEDPPEPASLGHELDELKAKLTLAQKHARSTVEHYAEAASDEYAALAAKVKNIVQHSGRRLSDVHDFADLGEQADRDASSP